MQQVFISYSRDNRDLAAALASALERRGLTVWWDRELAGGDDFRRMIGTALRGAEACIVIWTPTSVESRWVLDEADVANQAKKLVPAAFSPINFQIPLGFGQLHTQDLSTWDRSSPDNPEINELVASINRIRESGNNKSLLTPGGRGARGEKLRNDALSLFANIGNSIGGLPISRFAIGALLTAFAITVLVMLGSALSGANLVTALVLAPVWWVVMMAIRGLYQFVALSKGMSSRRFFDPAFSFWLLLSLFIGIFFAVIATTPEAGFGALILGSIDAGIWTLGGLGLLRAGAAAMGFLIKSMRTA